MVALAQDFLQHVAARYESGETCDQIGESVGRSEAAIRYALDKVGVRRRDSKVQPGQAGLNRGRVFSSSWCNNLSRNHADVSGTKNPSFGSAPSPLTSRGRGGVREDLGHRCRSSWEANFARVMRAWGVPYEYEPVSFLLEGTSYTPDFWLPALGLYIEISGYTPSSKLAKVAAAEARYGIRVLLVERDLYSAIVRSASGVNLEPDRVIGRKAGKI